MKTLTITAVILVSVGLSFLIERWYRHRCPCCGCRMHRHYDAEEDAPVHQCPRCGRSYLTKK